MTDKSKILIVAADKDDMELLDSLLKSNGYDVEAVADMKDVHAKATESLPTAILISQAQLNSENIELAKKLRADESTHLTSIAIISDQKRYDDFKVDIDSTYDDFIPKPFEENDLLIRLRVLIKLGQYRSKLNEMEKFEYYIEKLGEGIVVLGADVKIQRINQKAKDLLGITNGKRALNFQDEMQKEFNINYEGKFSDDLTTKPITFQIERPETEHTKALFLELRTSIIKNPAGDVGSIIIVINDVTDKQKEELMKQDFLSLISHKMRTPLTNIEQRAYMLRERMFNTYEEQKSKAIDPIIGSSTALASTVDKLVGFVTLTSERLETNKELIDVNNYFQDLKAKAKVALEKELGDKLLEFEVTLPKMIIMLNMNRSHLDLIMASLVDNAVIFNDKQVVRIHLNIKDMSDKIAICVTDNGPGIPMEERERIFEKFYQIDKYFTGNVEGVGLGLSLVKRLANLYGGMVRLDSTLKKGSTFIVILPLDYD